MYPDVAPEIKFSSRVNLTFVHAGTGVVQASHLRSMNPWNPSTTMENILTEIRKEMATGVNKKAVQPEEGLTFDN